MKLLDKKDIGKQHEQIPGVKTQGKQGKITRMGITKGHSRRMALAPNGRRTRQDNPQRMAERVKGGTSSQCPWQLPDFRPKE